MANNQELWFQKLKSWVPKWFFELEENNEAVFRGVAEILNKLECMADDHVLETFICLAEGGYLDEHGLERNVDRILNELDVTLRERVKNITNTTSCAVIKQLVDSLLDVGEATLLEDFDAGVYFDRDDYFDRGEVFISPIYNTFSIIVDNQVHAPYSFFDREYFADREDFIGLLVSRLELFELIVEHVNRTKALGIFYRLIERLA